MTTPHVPRLIVAVFGPRGSTTALARALESRGMVVYELDPKVSAMPAFIKPDFLVYFLSANPWPESLRLAREVCHHLRTANPDCRFVLLGQALDHSRQQMADLVFKNDGAPAVKLNLTPVKNLTDREAADAIVYQLEGVPNQLWAHVSSPPEWVQADLIESNFQRIFFDSHPVRTDGNFWRRVIVLTFVLSFLSSIFALGTVIVPLGIAVFEVNQLKNNYSRISRSEVRNSLQRAQSNFDLTRDGLARLSPVLSAVGLRNHVAQVDNFASLGARGCQVGRQLVELSPSVEAVISGVTEPTSPTYSDTVTYSLAPQLAQMSSDLSQIEAGYKNISPSIKFWLLGNSASFLENIIADSRSLVDGLAGISTNIADIVGIKAQKKYLIVLQNPAEIRATGGFIGSFAVLGFDDGKLVNFKLHDIYDADGQLQGRVAPPDEILHFLGQPNWYMRDANWSPDFPLTARRLEWFLQKETGDKVDGVVSVDVHAATKLLEATGPINLPDFDDTVNHSNFFEKAEFQSEINFFPGSSQKKDYLSAAAMGLMTKLTSGQVQNPLLLVSAISNSLKEKNIFFYFNDPKIQEVMERNNWAGSIRPDFCKNPNSSCLMTVDSNLGANKANFYLSRNFQATGRINKAGDVDIELTVNYQNNSPSRTWPGGDYKNYLRFILPEGSKIDSLTLGDSRQATYSSVLTAKALATVPLNRFLVKQSTESALLELGSLINIPVQSSGSATLKFRLPYQVDLTNSTPDLAISFLKQPGTVSDQFKFTLEYPSFLSPILESSTLDRSSTLVFDQKLVYNSAMDQDKRILVRFLRTNP